MSNIAYDPIKDRFSLLIGKSKLRRTLFYYLLDMMFLRSWYVRKTLKQWEHKLGKGKSLNLLDAGSGFGQYEHFILKNINNVTITAIDIKEDYLRSSVRYFQREIDKGKINFLNKNLYDLDYQEKFDMVLCVDILEHIEDDELVLNNVGRALKKGGHFLMHSPSSCYASEDEIFVDEHFRQGYTKDEIEVKLNKAGLKSIINKYTYGWAGHLAWLIGIKTPMQIANKLKYLGFAILAVYLPIILLPYLILNFIDTKCVVRKGRGILVLAKKR